MVYDITTYLTSPPAIRTPTGMQAPGDTDVNFMHGSVLDLFKKFNAGRDITKQLDHLNIDKGILARRQGRQSTVASMSFRQLHTPLTLGYYGGHYWWPLSVSNFWHRSIEDHNKFVIWQVPCYTEDDISLRTIDSLAQTPLAARMRYHRPPLPTSPSQAYRPPRLHHTICQHDVDGAAPVVK
jgi:chitin synthase